MPVQVSVASHPFSDEESLDKLLIKDIRDVNPKITPSPVSGLKCEEITWREICELLLAERIKIRYVGIAVCTFVSIFLFPLGVLSWLFYPCFERALFAIKIRACLNEINDRYYESNVVFTPYGNIYSVWVNVRLINTKNLIYRKSSTRALKMFKGEAVQASPRAVIGVDVETTDKEYYGPQNEWEKEAHEEIGVRTISNTQG